ncbi:nitroreductase [Halalkalibacter oceani]
MMQRTAQQGELGVFQTIEERHSVRKFDPEARIEREELEELLTIATKAPSSWNIQPWRFIVVDDPKRKEELLPIAYNQKQVVESAAVIILLGDLEANKEAEAIYQTAVDNGFMPKEVKETLVGQINKAYEGNSTFPRDEAFLSTSLAAMQLMLAAKARGYDTCPMGGFSREALIETFDIPSRYAPVMLLAIGKAAQPAHRSARRPLEDVMSYNSLT